MRLLILEVSAAEIFQDQNPVLIADYYVGKMVAGDFADGDSRLAKKRIGIIVNNFSLAEISITQINQKVKAFAIGKYDVIPAIAGEIACGNERMAE